MKNLNEHQYCTQQALDRLETEESIKIILFAVELGSRTLGFPLPDGDNAESLLRRKIAGIMFLIREMIATASY